MKTVAAFLLHHEITPVYFLFDQRFTIFCTPKKESHKMKKLFALILLFSLLSKAYAQEGEDVGWVARFGAALGVTPAYVFPDVTPLNKGLSSLNIPELSKGIFVYGAGGYAYVMIVDNLRLGGIGLTGSQASSGKLSAELGGYNFELKYSFSFGGLSVEYTLPFINKIAVSVGAIIGLGTQIVDNYYNTGSYKWDDIWPKASGGLIKYSLPMRAEVKNNFISISPTLNVDIPLNRFIAVRIGGGYVLPISQSWEVNNDQDISLIPTDLKANSFFIQTGIYFGFFAF